MRTILLTLESDVSTLPPVESVELRSLVNGSVVALTVTQPESEQTLFVSFAEPVETVMFAHCPAALQYVTMSPAIVVFPPEPSDCEKIVNFE